jgi:hypothetical protein
MHGYSQGNNANLTVPSFALEQSSIYYSNHKRSGRWTGTNEATIKELGEKNVWILMQTSSTMC